MVHTFDEALARAQEIKQKTPHLLLGNGFSIACRPKCFRYESIFAEADLSELSVGGELLFGSEETHDFERVIRALRAAARMADLYATSDRQLSRRLCEDADRLRDVLARTLADNHPDNVGSIGAGEYAAARAFLSNFDHFFTLNYDLLLYWALLGQIERVEYDDGFRSDPENPEAAWVAWNSFSQYKQKVYFLHGGLHLYMVGSTLRKLTFKRTGEALLTQIRAQLAADAFPLIVTEGTSAEKLATVLRSAYLGKCVRSLASCTGCFFIHGHSLDENDDHVLRALVDDGKSDAIFVGLHGDPESEANLGLRGRAEALALRRAKGKKKLAVEFYESESAAVWG